MYQNWPVFTFWRCSVSACLVMACTDVLILGLICTEVTMVWTYNCTLQALFCRVPVIKTGSHRPLVICLTVQQGQCHIKLWSTQWQHNHIHVDETQDLWCFIKRYVLSYYPPHKGPFIFKWKTSYSEKVCNFIKMLVWNTYNHMQYSNTYYKTMQSTSLT